MSKENTTPTGKKKYWAFVLYPESAPSDWKERLQLTGLPIAISPLHNKDVNPTGEPKKEHYHCILCYSGPTTYNAVKTLTDSLNQPIPQPLEAVRGYYRYLTHKDNPEKAQYDEGDIIHLNGFNILDYITLTSAEVATHMREIIQFIRDEHIIEYCDLLYHYMEIEDWEKLDVATNHTIALNACITSQRHKSIEEMADIRKIKIDPETGEVL